MSSSQTGTGWWLDQIGRVPLLTPAQEIELGTRIQQWLNHPDGPDSCPRAVRRSGQRAKEQFVAANLRLAVSYVTKHCHRLAKLGHQDDLIQAANLGVIRAVEKYDPTRGYRFSTYAYWWIRQSVSRWVDQHSRLISIPGSHSQLLGRIEMTRRRMTIELGRPPTRQEIADELDLKIEMLERLLERAVSPLSLDQSSGRDEEGGELGLFIGSHDLDPEQQEMDEMAANVAAELLSRLTPQQRRVIEAKFGINRQPLTTPEIAKAERISTRSVEAIIQQAIATMERKTHQPPVKLTAAPVGERLTQLSLLPGLVEPQQPSRGSGRRRAQRGPACTQAQRPA